MSFAARAALVEEILDRIRLEIESDRRQIGGELDKLSDLALTALSLRLYPAQKEPMKVICVRCVQTEREELERAKKPKKRRGAR